MDRILYDPTPTEGGGSTPTPTPTPTTPSVPTPPPPPPPPTAQTIPLSVDEFERLRGAERRLAAIEAENQAKMEAKERDRIKALAEKGEVEKALKEQEDRWQAKYATLTSENSQVIKEFYGERQRNVIHTALAGASFRSPEAKQDAIEKLDRNLETVRDSAGNIVVRDKATGRPAADVIRESIASPAFFHFLEAPSKGGGGQGGGSSSSPTPNPEARPKDRLAEQLKASVERARTGAPGLAGTYNNN